MLNRRSFIKAVTAAITVPLSLFKAKPTPTFTSHPADILLDLGMPKGKAVIEERLIEHDGLTGHVIYNNIYLIGVPAYCYLGYFYDDKAHWSCPLNDTIENIDEAYDIIKPYFVKFVEMYRQRYSREGHEIPTA